MTETIYYQYYASPVGRLLLLVQGEKLIFVEFEHEQKTTDLSQFVASEQASGQIQTLFCKIALIFDRYFKGEAVDFSQFDFIAPKGTPFQQAVWQMLRQIPYGEKISYGEIAARLGKPNAVRAVGGAVGRNPISILIPCHRVLGKSQALTGFGGGLPAKRYLLQLEKIAYQDSGIEFVKPKNKKWQ